MRINMKYTKLKAALSALLFATIFSAISVTSSANSDTTSVNTNKDYVVDEADLLTDTEESELESKIVSFVKTYEADIVIVTENSIGNKTATEFADDYFDYNGYGQGSSDDGILFLISMENRDWAISTKGYSIQVFTDSRQETMVDEMISDLSGGNYYDAFNTFINNCDYYYDVEYSSPGGQNYTPFNIVTIGICLLIGFLLALIPLIGMFAQLKPVHSATGAVNYEKDGSRQMTVTRDRFIRHHITKVPIPKNDDHGGSSTHTSSSGSSHGGSSGHF